MTNVVLLSLTLQTNMLATTGITDTAVANVVQVAELGIIQGRTAIPIGKVETFKMQIWRAKDGTWKHGWSSAR